MSKNLKIREMFSGLQCTANTAIKAFSVRYRGGYPDGAEICYGKSRGAALISFMRNNHESDFMDMRKLTRVLREHDSDFVDIAFDDSETGRFLSQIHASMSFVDKLSLLNFGGINIGYLDGAFSKSEADQKRRPSAPFSDYVSLGDYVGRVVSGSDDHPTFYHEQLMTTKPFKHASNLYYHGLTDLGGALFLMCLQDLSRGFGRLIHKRMIEQWLFIYWHETKRGTELTIEKSPKVFHKLFSQHVLSPELSEQPSVIYSGQWGMYWRDTSGYCQQRHEARIFPLHEALRLTSHCGDEKRIYIELLLPESRPHSTELACA